MKKLILFLLLPISINVFAQNISLSFGAGGLMGYTFTRYSLEGGSVSSSQQMDRIDYAGLLFLDAKYAEFSVLLQGGNNNYSENMIFEVASLANAKGKGAEVNIGFSLLGKFPFRLNEKFTWFPMLGIEFQMAQALTRQPDGDLVYDRRDGHLPEDRDKNGDPYPLSAWNSWWIDVGAGLDFFITDKLFLRSALIFGFRLPTAYEMGALEVVKNPPMNVENPKLAGLTGGPSLKIAIGYRAQ